MSIADGLSCLYFRTQADEAASAWKTTDLIAGVKKEEQSTL